MTSVHAIATGAIDGASRAHGSAADGLAAAACGLLLVAISVHDARTGEIPLRYTLGGSAAALAWAGFRMGPAAAGVRGLAAAGAALGLWALARCVGRMARHEVMGEGDALLLGFLAIVAGPARVGSLLAGAATLALAVFAARLLPAPWRAPAACVTALLAGGAFVAGGWARLGALALPLAVVWPRRQGVGEPLPFGPMLAAGAVLALFTPSPLPWPTPAAAIDTPLFMAPRRGAPAASPPPCADRSGFPCASYGWGDHAQSYALGLYAGSCARRWTLGVSYRDGTEGSSLGFSASLRLMDSSCSEAR